MDLRFLPDSLAITCHCLLNSAPCPPATWGSASSGNATVGTAGFCRLSSSKTAKVSVISGLQDSTPEAKLTFPGPKAGFFLYTNQNLICGWLHTRTMMPGNRQFLFEGRRIIRAMIFNRNLQSSSELQEQLPHL